MAGRQLAPLILSDEERLELKTLASRGKTARALALRARIVLARAEGSQNKEVAANSRFGPTETSWYTAHRSKERGCVGAIKRLTWRSLRGCGFT
jgi:hypothetical protein